MAERAKHRRVVFEHARGAQPDEHAPVFDMVERPSVACPTPLTGASRRPRRRPDSLRSHFTFASHLYLLDWSIIGFGDNTQSPTSFLGLGFQTAPSPSLVD